MEKKEPTCHAQRINDELFNATGALTTIAQEVRRIASAMMVLGLPAGEDLYRMGEDISSHAKAAAEAHAEHVGRQANGTLYQPLKLPA